MIYDTDDHENADQQKVHIRDSSELLPETLRQPCREGVLGGGDGVGVDPVAWRHRGICPDVDGASRLVVVDTVHYGTEGSGRVQGLGGRSRRAGSDSVASLA